MLSYWWRHEAAPASALSAEPTAPRLAIRFPPLDSPGLPSAAQTRYGQCGLGAPGGGRSAGLLPFRCPPRVVTSRCSVVGLAIGQSPTEPNRQRHEQAHSAIARHPRYAVMPGHSVSQGSTATMNPPRAKPEPASLFRGTRSGSLQDQVQICKSRRLSRPLRGLCELGSSVLPFPAGLLCFAPSHIPSDGLLEQNTPDQARAPLFLSRKNHQYVKTKKSTHDHQNAKPFCTHSDGAVPDDRAGQGEHNGVRLACWRRPWRP